MGNKITIVATLALAVLYAVGTAHIEVPQLGDPLGPRAFPMLVCIGLFAAVGLLAFETFVRGPVTDEAEGDQPEEPKRWVVPTTAALTALYFLAFEPVGYALASSIFLSVLCSIFRPGRWFSNIATAFLFSFGSYLLFTQLLHVRLPPGILPI
jgi:putative tricarboxylic transport membrane protein